MTLPMTGVRIVDLTSVLSGPIATSILASQGADVIKVEPPGGDTSRKIGPQKGDLSAMFISANSGKRSLALDLKSAEGLAIVRELVRGADAVVENFRPGTMKRLGLDYETLAAINPKLVYVSITGFGPDGPYADGRVYDPVIQAISGIAASHPTFGTEEPALVTTAICDKVTSLTAAQAITAALFAAAREGKGRLVELSMLDAAMFFQWVDAMYNLVFVDDPPPRLPEYGVTAKPYHTRDGHVTLAFPQADEFHALVDGLGHSELKHDPRFESAVSRSKYMLALRAEIEHLIADWNTDDLFEALRSRGVPIGKINSRAGVFDDAQVVHNDIIATVEHGAVGRVRLPRMAAHFSGPRRPDPKPAPRLGEHTASILRDLGYDPARIDALVARGTVKVLA